MPPPPQPQSPPQQPPHTADQPPPQYQHGHQQYPPPQYYHPYHHRRSKPSSSSSSSSSSSFASCLLATLFLLAIAVAAAITCFILFRPQDPQITVTSMRFPSFTSHNATTANFTFFQYVAVRNPNRFTFSHYDSSLQLFSSSSGPVGFVYIPAGKIAAGRTQYMTATFDVRSFPVGPDMSQQGVGPTMELESRMKLVGTVKVLKVFAHHVEKGATCRVTLQVSDGSVLGYHC